MRKIYIAYNETPTKRKDPTMIKRIKAKIEQIKTDYDLENEDIATFALFGTMAAGLAALTAYAVVDEVKTAKRQSEWGVNELEAGRQVYQLANGALISTSDVRICQ